MKRITYAIIPHKTGIRLLGVARNPANGFPARPLGVSFKKDIGDTRNSPAMRVAELLLEKGATVAYSDRHAPEVTIGGCPMKSVELDEATLPSHDATVILVDHSYYDLEMIVRHSKLVIDTRDATRRLGPQPTVVKL